ncbi:MAG: GAF domain-containing protein, partial [Burkholderiales bacterium]
LGVPMLRGGNPIGAIVVGWAEPGPIPKTQEELLKTFADQAVIAIENVRLFNETKEALERQTATAEILKIIAGSPGNVQPVLDAVAERVALLCDAPNATVWLAEGELLRSAATYWRESGADDGHGTSLPIRRTTINGEAFLDRQTVHIADVVPLLDSKYPDARERTRRMGLRATVVVPMIREGSAIGTISLWRREPGYFSNQQVALLQTFADQAVIAIENVRLFNETKEALERQTATAEILRVISRSVENTSPVFDAIVEACVRLFPGHQVGINMMGDDGHVILQACHSPHAEALKEYFRRGPERKEGTDFRLRRRVAHFPDIESDPDVPDVVRGGCKVTGARAFIYAPMVSGDRGIGTIWIGRERPGPFSDKEIALLQTFADQAVIAIQNARLFTETKEALQRQTATSEVLDVISRSQTDVQPVFDTIAANALRLCEASFSHVTQFDGELIHLAAFSGVVGEAADALRKALGSIFPMPPGRGGATARAIMNRAIAHIPDVSKDPEYKLGEAAQTANLRCVLAVPMLRAGTPIGAITVGRNQPTGFPEQQIALLKTFADQAVIAIENVRLFNETKEALERQTATAEILRVIASSPSDVQPVFDTIAKSALALCKGMYANVFRYDGEMLHFMATESIAPRLLDLLKTKYPMRPDASQASGRVILTKSVVRIEDSLLDPNYDRNMVAAGSFRRMLGMPMLRDGMPLGVIVVTWAESGPVLQHHEQLLQTFADQAV